MRIRRKRQSKKQAAWNYMRSNRAFCIGDLLLATGMDRTYLKSFIWHLENTGYLRVEDESKSFWNRCYRLVRDSGPIAPSNRNGEVYDYNLKKSFYTTHKIKQILLCMREAMEGEAELLEYLEDPLAIVDIREVLRHGDRYDAIDMAKKIVEGKR